MESPVELTGSYGARKHYDLIAPVYDTQRFGCRCGSILNDVERGIARRLVAPDSKVLDVGTGTGRFAATLASASSRIVALDSSSQMISNSAAKRNLSEPSSPISYVIGDGASLPFSSGSFDAVISIKLLSHFRDIDPFVSEMARVLRRGGQLIIDISNPLAEVYGHFSRSPSIQSYEDHFHTLPEVEHVFQTYSVQVSRRITYSALPLSLVHLGLCPHPDLIPSSLLRLVIAAKRGLLNFVEGIKLK